MCCLPDDVFLHIQDFDGGVSYTNVIMKNMRYRLIRDKDVILTPGLDYLNKVGGGFDLVGFEVGDDTVIVIQFY